jgi:hypothetical protein
VPQYTRAGILKRGILCFWSLWISTVVVMNLGDLIRAAGMLPSDSKLASGNYAAIVKVTSVYEVPHWMDWLLLLAVSGLEAMAAGLFWRALRSYHRSSHDRWQAIYLAFTLLLGVFGMMILGDEIFHAYGIEGDHRGIAVLLLASLLAVQLLPEKVERG